MTKFERIRSVLNGEQPDRLPFSFWHHFGESQRKGTAAIAAHAEHLLRYDVDFLKIMNDLPYPVEPLRSIREFNPKLFTELRGTEGSFGQHLDVIRGLSKCVGHGVPLVMTLFGPWTVLRRYLMDPHLNVRGVPQFGSPTALVDIQINQLIADRPLEMAHVFRAIAKSQANFARKCVEAGASGVYFSVRKDWPNLGSGSKASAATYDSFVLPFDQLCLEGASEGWLNLLHICGEFHDLAEFKTLPAQVIHWADRKTGPTLLQASQRTDRVICGGIDNFEGLCNRDPRQLIAEIAEALQIGTMTPMIIAPGCAYDAELAQEGHLRLIRELVDEKTSTLSTNFTQLPATHVAHPLSI